jgi:hypothetical protein
MRRVVLIAALALGAVACGGDGASDEGHTLKNVTAIATSGRATSSSHQLHGCLTWEPAGVTSGSSHKAVVGCGVILPGAAP